MPERPSSAGVIRARTVAEFADFAELIDEYERSLPEDLRHTEFAREIANISAHYSVPHAAFVAVCEGAPAGCVALTLLGDDSAIVKKMYVRPAFRRHGIARALMATLTAYARENGVARLVLDTARERLRAAYELYRSLGFRECEPYGAVDYRCPTFMELRLDTTPE